MDHLWTEMKRDATCENERLIQLLLVEPVRVRNHIYKTFQLDESTQRRLRTAIRRKQNTLAQRQCRDRRRSTRGSRKSGALDANGSPRKRPHHDDGDQLHSSSNSHSGDTTDTDSEGEQNDRSSSDGCDR
eukprot:Opistho-2@17719